MKEQNAIELRNISKSFGDVAANKNVSLALKKGEILSLLGENGSGKTTLMNMIAGIYFPDSGEILVDGKEVVIRSPKDAFDNKIGMVHQHFKLVDVFTAAQNIILGDECKYNIKNEYNKLKEDEVLKNNKAKLFFKICALPFIKMGHSIKHDWLRKKDNVSLTEITSKYGFDIDLNKKIYDMSVSEKQTVEIIKVLYKGADILILDEPTAVLTPQETEKLFAVMRKMQQDNKAIIIITHKLNEVLEISDKVAVLRKGEYIGTVDTKDATEKSLTEMMVGKKVELDIDRPQIENKEEKLIVKNICCKNQDGRMVLDNVSFTAKTGEILGIAGIAGSGQKELLEAIAGLQKFEGDILYNEKKEDSIEQIDLRSKNPAQIRDLGIRLSFVPEDRLGMGLVANMDLVDNVMLRSYKKGRGLFLDRKKPKDVTNTIVKELEVATPNIKTPVRRLSGGNVQKVLVGREIASTPSVFMAAYPVRGLDINSSYTIYHLLNEQKKKGVAVIYVGEDLDVLMQLCDRVVVLCAGKVSDIVNPVEMSKEDIGLRMTKQEGYEKEFYGENVENKECANNE